MEKLALWLQPVVEPFFPRRRFLKNERTVDQPIHIPSAPTRRRSPVQASAEAVLPAEEGVSSRLVESGWQVPFVVDPVSRTIKINLECAIGDGEFGGEILAAASSLEQNLRLAADQIRALVDTTPSVLNVAKESYSAEETPVPGAPIESVSTQIAESAEGILDPG